MDFLYGTPFLLKDSSGLFFGSGPTGCGHVWPCSFRGINIKHWKNLQKKNMCAEELVQESFSVSDLNV